MTVELGPLTPAAEEGWSVLFDLAEVDSEHWVLLGGQMVYLLAVEHGAIDRARSTEDIDVVVDVRARQRGTEWLAAWLARRGFELDGVSPDGIGHRFARSADPGPGRVLFDVLAPEGLGSRTTVFTEPPARTVQVPGSKQAIDRSEVVEVAITGVLDRTASRGRVRRPNLLGAIIAKAAATTIPVRANADRDWQDAALLLALLADPIGAAEQCTKSDRRRLRALAPLRGPAHVGWDGISDLHPMGIEALEFLVAEPR